MKTAWRRGVLGTLAIALTTTGCYRYVPAQIETTPPGTDVRLLMTRAGARQVEEAGALGATDEPRVNGSIVAVENDNLLVRVPVTTRQEGFIERRLEQAVAVPIGEIVSFQRRELNGLATALTISGAVVAAAALFAVIVDPLGGSDTDPDPPPDELMLNLFSIPFSLGR